MRESLQARIVSGSIGLLSGSGLNTAINLVYNIEIARALGSRRFGHPSLIASRGAVAQYLNLPDSKLVSLIAIGAVFYVPLGTRRGFVQGTYRFRNLAINLVIEQAVRLIGSVALIDIGWGLYGVIAANSAAIAIPYYSAAVKLSGRPPNSLALPDATHVTAQATVCFAVQMIIDNCGI